MTQCVLKVCSLLACLVVTAGFDTSPEGGNRTCPQPEVHFSAPASEVAEIIAGWLDGRGYTVRRNTPRPGTIHLIAWQSTQHIEAIVRPRSALGAAVTMQFNGAVPTDVCRRVKDHVDAELSGGLSGTSSPTPALRSPTRPAPNEVLDQFDAVVCIHAGTHGSDVQFSGFLVDPAGLVLCTAHDLVDHQKVMVTFYDGSHVSGTIVRLDPDRDIALIACETGGTDNYVSLTAARNLLGMGERIFSIGCPNRLSGTLSSGSVNGPPRRVGNQALWQVDMPIYPGSSGSPVFDDRGRLVAMVKGRYRGTATVGFLTPIETIIAFLLEDTGP